MVRIIIIPVLLLLAPLRFTLADDIDAAFDAFLDQYRDGGRHGAYDP